METSICRYIMTHIYSISMILNHAGKPMSQISPMTEEVKGDDLGMVYVIGFTRLLGRWTMGQGVPFETDGVSWVFLNLWSYKCSLKTNDKALDQGTTLWEKTKTAIENGHLAICNLFALKHGDFPYLCWVSWENQQ